MLGETVTPGPPPLGARPPQPPGDRGAGDGAGGCRVRDGPGPCRVPSPGWMSMGHSRTKWHLAPPQMSDLRHTVSHK